MVWVVIAKLTFANQLIASLALCLANKNMSSWLQHCSDLRKHFFILCFLILFEWFLAKISKDFQIFRFLCLIQGLGLIIWWFLGIKLKFRQYFSKSAKIQTFLQKSCFSGNSDVFSYSQPSIAYVSAWRASVPCSVARSPEQILSLAEMSAQSSSRSKNWAAQVHGPSWPLARRSSSRNQNWAAQVSGPSWPLARRISNLNFSARFEYISPAFSFSESFCPLVSRVKEAPWSKEKFR